MSIEELRKRIDEADVQIVRLLAERIRISEEIGKEKKNQGRQIGDSEREKIVLENIRRIARDEKISQEDVESIYQQIITASKSVQGIAVAFQGEIGAYSEEAAFQFFGHSIQAKPCESLDDVFQVVERDEAQFGIVLLRIRWKAALVGGMTCFWTQVLGYVVKQSFASSTA